MVLRRKDETARDGGGTGTESPTSKNPFTPEFDEFVNAALHDWHVPGISIAIIDDNEIFANGYGFANLPDQPVTPQTLFSVGSVTKAHTAAALSQLIHSNSFPELSKGWSTPISSLIRDDFVLQDEWATNHITLDDAVCHRTGIARHDHSWHNAVDGREATPKDVVRNLRHLPLSVEPRLEFHYSNLMYVTLSHVVETVTGRKLADVLKDDIWSPLAMNSTFLSLEEAKASHYPTASSYQWNDKKRQYDKMPELDCESVSGAGGIVSTVCDFAKWVKCLIDQAEPFSEDVHKDIRTPRFPVSMAAKEIMLYGLGWQRTTIHGELAYTHSGYIHTMGSMIWWLPAIKYGVVLFENGAGTLNAAESIVAQRLIEDKLRVPLNRRTDLTDELKQEFERRKDNVKQAEEIVFPDRPSKPLPPSASAAKLAGTYVDPGYGSVTLSVQSHNTKPHETMLVANRLEIRWGERWELAHISGDYWLLYIMFPSSSDLTTQFYSAKFAIGEDGNISTLEVDFYDTDENLRQGIVRFIKVNDRS